VDFRLNASVICSGDVAAGHVTGVIVDPATKALTHIVVRTDHVQRIVPTSLILSATADRVNLSCTLDHLREQQHLTETDYVQSPVDPYNDLPAYSYVGINPYVPVIDEPETYPVKHSNIPSGEREISRGMAVFAVDGRIGRADDIVVDAASGHITALVLREGHLWGTREVTIPAAHIQSIENDGVHLKLTRDQVAQLQTASATADASARSDDHDMNVPVHAVVRCTDGDFGHTTCLIINPITRKITHFVVSEANLLGTQHIVPVSFITATTADSITVRCDRATLGKQPNFIKYEYDTGDTDESYYWPMMLTAYPDMYIPGPGYIPLEHEQIPVGELAIRRGMAVTVVSSEDAEKKTDPTTIGHVDSLVVDPATGKISHLTLRKGHLWGQRDITIPVTAIARILPSEVRLKLTRAEVEALPAVPVKRLL
jgi:sporulation protein YlmC with PRC-barrel domain